MPDSAPQGGFSPVQRRSVSDEVFAELRDAILTGRFQPGDTLPPERELAASFAVNRHAVREALKRLQEAGFVQIVHGGATTVLDVRSSAGLDLLAHLARSGKILRKTMREMADGGSPTVPSTIEDASVLDALGPVLRRH